MLEVVIIRSYESQLNCPYLPGPSWNNQAAVITCRLNKRAYNFQANNPRTPCHFPISPPSPSPNCCLVYLQQTLISGDSKITSFTTRSAVQSCSTYCSDDVIIVKMGSLKRLISTEEAEAPEYYTARNPPSLPQAPEAWSLLRWEFIQGSLKSQKFWAIWLNQVHQGVNPIVRLASHRQP